MSRPKQRKNTMPGNHHNHHHHHHHHHQNHNQGVNQSPVTTSTRKKRRGMIEKKRRDKINTSLMELRRLVPAAFEKQGSAKLEKAEILQMTVDYLRTLHARGIDHESFHHGQHSQPPQHPHHHNSNATTEQSTPSLPLFTATKVETMLDLVNNVSPLNATLNCMSPTNPNSSSSSSANTSTSNTNTNTNQIVMQPAQTPGSSTSVDSSPLLPAPGSLQTTPTHLSAGATMASAFQSQVSSSLDHIHAAHQAIQQHHQLHLPHPQHLHHHHQQQQQQQHHQQQQHSQQTSQHLQHQQSQVSASTTPVSVASMGSANVQAPPPHSYHYYYHHDYNPYVNHYVHHDTTALSHLPQGACETTVAP